MSAPDAPPNIGRMSPAKAPAARPKWEAWGFALLILLPLLAYSRLVTAGFIWDDDVTLTANPLIAASDGLWRMWFTTQSPDYWPVTYSSLWLEWRIWGLWAPGYHLTNVLLHIGEGILLWRLLERLKIPGAYFAALWFALHPLNVESVAWIAQRKTLLAMLFFLLSLRAMAESAALESGRIDRWCVLAWLAFVLSLLSKASTAPLPFVLLGWVLWRRRLRGRDALWLGIFFATAVALVLVNIGFAHRPGAEVIRAIGWPERLAGAGGAFWFYLGKIFWPVELCFVYPGWIVPPVHPIWWLGLGLAVAITVALWLGRARGARRELWAWLYFGVMLLPVVGLTDVYFMRYSLVADHYAHLAIIGVLVWAAAGFVQLRLSRALGFGVALGFGALTWMQTGIYRDDFALFDSVLARNPDCWMAHNNLGKALLDSRTPDGLAEATEHFQAAVRLKPDFVEAYNNLGNALQRTPGRSTEAIAQYEQALWLRPGMATLHNNLGIVLEKMPGRLNDAIAQYAEAVRLDPDYIEARYNLGAALNAAGRVPEAIAQYEEALRLNPKFALVHGNLGAALAAEGRTAEAMAQFEEALRLKPDSAVTHYNLGIVLKQLPGRLNDAIAQYAEAVRLQPDYAEAHYNLGNALYAAGRVPEAIAQFGEALRVQPDYVAAHFNLGVTLLQFPGRADEGASHLETVLRLQPQNEQARQILTRFRAEH